MNSGCGCWMCTTKAGCASASLPGRDAVLRSVSESLGVSSQILSHQLQPCPQLFPLCSPFPPESPVLPSVSLSLSQLPDLLLHLHIHSITPAIHPLISSAHPPLIGRSSFQISGTSHLGSLNRLACSLAFNFVSPCPGNAAFLLTHRSATLIISLPLCSATTLHQPPASILCLHLPDFPLIHPHPLKTSQ